MDGLESSTISLGTGSADGPGTRVNVAEPPSGALGRGPVASVVIANYNGAAYLDDCLASARGQTLACIEIIVIDDGSTDASVAIIRSHAERDGRIALIETAERRGPGAARNRGLAVARGDWIAILDSDDLMHPERLARLVECASRTGADIVADNQIVFDERGGRAARPLLGREALAIERVVTACDYIDQNRLFSGGVPLGYLKPLFERSFLQRAGCLYDPTLIIAEDYDLVLRLLLSGAHFRLSPQLTYFYRKHSGSVSHRLSARTLLPMLAADDSLRAALRVSGHPLRASVLAALDRRRRSIERALRFEDLVADLKAGRWWGAAGLCLRRPLVAVLLAIPANDRLRAAIRRGRLRSDRPATSPRVTVLSRQRVVGRSNGSSAYLLSLCNHLMRAGYEIDLVSPSPAMFGRWPVLRFDPAMDLFASIRVRGSLRVGRFVVARDPRIALRAAAGVADRVLSRIGVRLGVLGRKAPHAIAVPLTDADRLFIVDAVRPSSMLLVDYAFLTEAIPFAMQPRAATAVVMHDLFSAQDSTRACVRLEQEAEMALLDRADAIVTIQAEETGSIRRLLPKKKIILAPIAVEPVAAAQPGQSGTMLFLGSNTVPNTDGINWFLREAWPEVQRLHPDARLMIAGGCCSGIAGAAANVDLLGVVGDLTELYAKVGLVISPLRLGSGLKIKLVEALGHGKAMVATSTTLQGVDGLLADAVRRADTAAGFAREVASLLGDRAARERLGERALEVSRRHFSSEVCYGELLDHVRGVSRVRRTANETVTLARPTREVSGQ